MTTRPARVLAQSWLPVSAVCCPIGGGLIKIGHGSNVVALVVAGAPCAICALLCCIFGIGYVAATLRFLRTGNPQREFIAVSANAIVSILSRLPIAVPPPAGADLACARPEHAEGSSLPPQRTRAAGQRSVG